MERGLRTATAPLVRGSATFCGFDLDDGPVADRVEEARREDSSLDIILVSLAYCTFHLFLMHAVDRSRCDVRSCEERPRVR